MDYTAKAIDALGKALYDQDITISTLKWERDSLKKQIAELEAQLKTIVETTVTITAKQEREV